MEGVLEGWEEELVVWVRGEVGDVKGVVLGGSLVGSTDGRGEGAKEEVGAYIFAYYA